MNPRPLGPEPSALPNCATPRFLLLKFTVGRSTTSWSLVAALGFSLASPRRAMLAFALGGSSSQKSRIASLAAIFGNPDRCALPNCATPRNIMLVPLSALNRNIADSLNIITKQNRFVKQKTEFAKEIKNIFRFRSPHNFADAHAQKGRQYAEHKIFGHIEQIIRDRGLPDGAVIHVEMPY